MKITFLSTYRPMQCGLATFSENLIKAIDSNRSHETVNIQVVAVHPTYQRFNFKAPVKYSLAKQQKDDYAGLANRINRDGSDICVIQHEFGIFGGQAGLYLLSLTGALKIPFIVTLHTVLKKPGFTERSIIQSFGKRAHRLVVMSNVAAELLQKVYGIPTDKIEVIEHGVPDYEVTPCEEFASQYNTGRNKVLFTFGLLGRNKGIETVLHALPKVVKQHPEVLYMILGKTHPNVLREHGEQYRDYLKSLVKNYDLEPHVFFLNKFLSEEQLFKYLSSIDIYITPYLNEHQVTSGTLSYAMGAGAAVVSTPYWHAKEALAEGRGRLFNFKDHQGLADTLNDLLANPQVLMNIRERALEYGRGFRWTKIGRRYLNLLTKVVKESEISAFSIGFYDHTKMSFPAFNIAHLKRLTDDTGIIQHARYGIPNFKEGYCLDDNSRALLVSIMANQLQGDEHVLDLIPVYFSYIQYMQNPNGTFRNFLSFNRQFLDENSSEDAFGRTVWALGYLLRFAPNDAYRQLSEEIFQKAADNFGDLQHPRGIANTIIGITYYLQLHPGDDRLAMWLSELTEKLIVAYLQHRSSQWQWFEPKMSYDNGILPLALWHSTKSTGDPKVREIATESSEFLTKETFKYGYLSPVGSNGWYVKDGSPAKYAQQAIDVMAMVLLFQQAFIVTRKNHYFQDMLKSYNWFLGYNDLKIPLYDPETHGCCDGLEYDGVNRNQGAESTLAYMISNIAVHETFEIIPDMAKDLNQSTPKVSVK